jgi:hypothetical protein
MSLRPFFARMGLCALGLLVPACSDPPDTPTSLVPAGYTTRFVQVRGCRNTIEHLASATSGAATSHIRVVINPEAAAAYRAGAATLPVGTLVIKEEFDDPDCRTVTGFTVMRKEPAGYDPAHGDWRWQRVRARDSAVLEDGTVQRCWSCHNRPACTARDWQCTEAQPGD